MVMEYYMCAMIRWGDRVESLLGCFTVCVIFYNVPLLEFMCGFPCLSDDCYH